MKSVRLAILLCFTLSSAAFAVPKYYEIGNGSTVAPFQGPEPPGGSGLVIQYALDAGLPGTNFILDDLQFTTFNFFQIWTDETFVNSGDDLALKPISATLDFVVPNVDATVTGNTFGQSVTFLGFISLQNGAVTWDGPAIVNIPGDRSFEVTLSDETFNFGVFGTSPGQYKGATVEATVKQLTSTSAVPEGGNTALAFGGGLTILLGLGRLTVHHRRL
ncbi:MAG TPA: hypothetical protein VGM62_08695 [Chthoniobacterales bacterium]|jgi:hypothetical protein